ncbi:MAG: hypothetical protein U1E76_20305 [Planctomycetota bacterium]
MPFSLVLLILGIQEPVQTTFPFARDLQSALREASDRRVPILYCNFDTWHMEPKPGDSGTPLKQVLGDANLARVVARTICILSSTEKHGEAKQIIDGVERTVCKSFGWMPCSAHKTVLDHVFKSFAHGGVLDFPHFYLASPDGKVLVSVIGERGPAILASEFEAALGEWKPGLERTVYQSCRAAFAEATAAERAGDFYRARGALESVQKQAKGYPPEQEALAALVRLNDSARQRKNDLVAALQKGEGNQLENLIALDDLAFGMGELAAGGQARSSVAELLRQARFATLLPELEQHRAARSLYFKCVALVKEGKRDPARRGLADFLKRYAGSRFEQRAKELMDEVARASKKP